MDLMPGMQTTSGALDAYKTQLETVARNLANAHTTRGPEGLPYQREVVTFESILDEKGRSGVTVAGIARDNRPGPLVHNPEHPHADANGMLRMPNVSAASEMVDMITASRAYEANLAAAETSRQMAEKALEIGR